MGLTGLTHLPGSNKLTRVRYPCDKCEYYATRPNHLREHIKNKHDGVRYVTY